MWIGSSLVFLLTALAGLWAAYDRGSAGEKFILLGAGIGVACSLDWLARQYTVRRFLGLIFVGCAVFGAMVGTFYFLPNLSFGEATAGALVVLLPLGIGGLAWSFWSRNWVALPTIGLALTWTVAVLVLTQERSAWLALAVGLVSALMSWRWYGNYTRTRLTWIPETAVVACLIPLLAAYVWIISAAPVDTWQLARLGGTVSDHLMLWHEAIALIQDYFFTGSGLNVTAMVFSTYVLQLHVPMYYHCHNLFLQMAIEQGMLGLAAFLAMAATAAYLFVRSWRRVRTPSCWLHTFLRVAAVAAFVTMLVHGLLDSELYASKLAPLQFLPVGLLAAAAHLDLDSQDCSILARGIAARRVAVFGLAVVVATGIVAALVTNPRVQAAFEANLGAVAQARAELSVYTWPKWPFQDEVRRTGAAPLAEATDRYLAALALDPGNVTANRRLGQIALSLGDYDGAQEHLERANVRAPAQPITRLLLGEAYAVTGNVESAAELWETGPIRDNVLSLRLRWYNYIGAEQQADWLRQAVTLAGHRPVER